MKKYDFKKVAAYIQEHKESLVVVTVGMKEDWFWTAEEVYRDDEMIVDLGYESLTLGGIDGSCWATPTMQAVFKDGREVWEPVYKGESSDTRPAGFSHGCLSGPCQEEIDKKGGQP